MFCCSSRDEEKTRPRPSNSGITSSARPIDETAGGGTLTGGKPVGVVRTILCIFFLAIAPSTFPAPLCYQMRESSMRDVPHLVVFDLKTSFTSSLGAGHP